MPRFVRENALSIALLSLFMLFLVGQVLTVDPAKIAQYISTYLDGAMVRAVILPDFDLAGAVDDLRETIWELLGCRRR